MLPFTQGQFFEVFARYNEAVWPMQWVLFALAVACVPLLYRGSAAASRMSAAFLAALWVWMAVAYHFAFFSAINPAAWLFGLAFVLQGLAFAWFGVAGARPRFEIGRGARGSLLGAGLIVVALAIYPAIGYLAGHRYPLATTFGLPCPSTIFTLGVMQFAIAGVPRGLFAVPIAWAFVGSIAAFQLGAIEDLALLAAGVAALAALAIPPFLDRRHAGQPR